ncbi:anti-sigma factor RsbA family regulatory protein [Actinoplanes palleronii]|nr:anti-sigma factor RsbA family regulatory protein [Actinoplanes palleronii]
MKGDVMVDTTLEGLSAVGDATTGFDHPGLLYHDRDDYLGGARAFARAAVAAGGPVLVAVPGPNLAALRDALSDLGDAVHYADMAVAGRNPGRIIPGVLLAFAAAHPGRRVSIIGEPVWPGRTAMEYPACGQHEALINAVFAGRDAAILCPYDAALLDQDRIDDVWRTHPWMIGADGRRPSPWFAGAFAAADRFNQPLPPVPSEAATLAYVVIAELSRVRAFTAGQARSAGLTVDQTEDLIVAVNELAENTIRHTPAGGTVSFWTEPGHLVCQVDDAGHLVNPLAGRIPPAVTSEGGRGLLLVNQLCDLVRIHTRPTGTTIRMHMTRTP